MVSRRTWFGGLFWPVRLFFFSWIDCSWSPRRISGFFLFLRVGLFHGACFFFVLFLWSLFPGIPDLSFRPVGRRSCETFPRCLTFPRVWRILVASSPRSFFGPFFCRTSCPPKTYLAGRLGLLSFARFLPSCPVYFFLQCPPLLSFIPFFC